MNCRFCAAPLGEVFLDLGSAPPSNAFLRPEQLDAPEAWFPLRLHTCGECRLVQVGEVQRHDELFSGDYVYFSSYSRSWLVHVEAYVAMAVARLGLGPDSLVLEVASNDGYLLQYVRERGLRCLGIEPTASTAAVARQRGIETVERFFGLDFARELVATRGAADLLVANNVLAHVPDLNDFVAGVAQALAPEGVATFEYPHLKQLVEQGQFDTVYHEHFSYFSFGTVRRILAAHGLRVFDVQALATHGGSLRVWACREGAGHAVLPSVAAMLDAERIAGMESLHWYRDFQARADSIKHAFLSFLIDCRRQGLRVAGYGAAAKGNTLLNYAGVRPDLLPFVVDASPHKQGRFLPGSRIPVVAEDRLRAERPDVVLILPWNLEGEIRAQLDYIRGWGGRFATAIPELRVS